MAHELSSPAEEGAPPSSKRQRLVAGTTTTTTPNSPTTTTTTTTISTRPQRAVVTTKVNAPSSSAYAGRRVRKLFGRQYFYGTVDGHKVVKGFPFGLYHVTYDDGDEEDLEEHELVPLLFSSSSAGAGGGGGGGGGVPKTPPTRGRGGGGGGGGTPANTTTAAAANANAQAHVGRRVRKKFGGKFFFGTVDGRKGAYFHVTYDDGDAEDLEEHELVPLLWSEDGGGGGGGERGGGDGGAKRGPGRPRKSAAGAAAASTAAAAQWEVTWAKTTRVLVYDGRLFAGIPEEARTEGDGGAPVFYIHLTFFPLSFFPEKFYVLFLFFFSDAPTPPLHCKRDHRQATKKSRAK